MKTFKYLVGLTLVAIIVFNLYVNNAFAKLYENIKASQEKRPEIISFILENDTRNIKEFITASNNRAFDNLKTGDSLVVDYKIPFLKFYDKDKTMYIDERAIVPVINILKKDNYIDSINCIFGIKCKIIEIERLPHKDIIPHFI